MSLGRIILFSMALGLVTGGLSAAILGDAAPPAGVGALTAFVSVIVAGRIQPVPRRRPRNGEPPAD